MKNKASYSPANSRSNNVYANRMRQYKRVDFE